MTRLHKSVLWTLAVCVFGFIAVRVLIVRVPSAAQAQQPATDPTENIPLPEDDLGGLGAKQAAPALEPARALVAVCVGDKGEPLDGVIVDIFRETPTESVFDPRVESFGRTKTTDEGRLAFSLPLIRGKTAESETAALYILYFTAPGRPIKSLIVEDDTELPKEIAIPSESTEEAYLPMHHLVVAKPEGISVSPMLSAIRGFSKDGQPIRVAKLVDHRNEGNQRTADSASMSAPRTDTNSTVMVAYEVRDLNAVEVAKVIESQFAGRFRQVGRDDRNSLIFVEADAETQAEIRGLIKHLEEHARLFRPSGAVQRVQVTAQEQIRAARQKLSAAKTDEERQFARAQLRKLLSTIFAVDMQMREKQADEIESRLAKLRQQYQAREKVKDEIIDLQLKVIEQDAAGLEFPGGTSAGSRTDPPTSATPTPDRPMTDRGGGRSATGRGPIIVSPDGRLYAYIVTGDDQLPDGMAEIRVRDIRTGKQLAAAIVKAPVGAFKFAPRGVAIRFDDGQIISFSTEHDAQDANPGAPQSDSARGATIPDRIKSLGLKLGHEMKTSLDRRHPMRITGKEGEVTIKAGETKLIELPKPTLAVQWQCGDFKPEAVDDVEPFDYVLVEWKSDGHVTWSCYRSPATSTPQAGTSKVDGEAGGFGQVED
jgi:hypothetical protein